MAEVLDYLRAKGYKVGKSKLYEDQYKIDHQKDGAMLRRDVDKYAAMFLRKLDGSDEGPADMAEKIKWETEIAKQKAEQLTRRNEVESGQYVLRSDVEQQFAARAASLKSSLEYFFRGMAPRIVELVQESSGSVPELQAFCLAALHDHLDAYSRPLVFAEAVIDDKGVELT
jgi:hypothetical protein